MEEKPYKSALKVNEGVDQPPQMNEEARNRFMHRKKPLLSAAKYFEGIRSGDTALFSQAITMIESALPKHQEIAQQIVELALPFSGNAIRVGITGVPGAGKSTFIDAFGLQLISLGHKVAVLAVDPSSERSKGSILGDKTRMEELSRNKNAFIRPSPSAGNLGGVARKTRESIIVCEAAGFNVILVETVGVGQSETAVHGMVDFFLLLMLSGAGDELQGIKRGIMEMCDAIFINKADGDNLKKAEKARVEYSNAIHMFPPTPSGWTPHTGICSAITGTGMPEVWETIIKYRNFTTENGFLQRKRDQQNLITIKETILEQIQTHFYQNEEIRKLLPKLETSVIKRNLSSYNAAKQLLKLYFKQEE